MSDQTNLGVITPGVSKKQVEALKDFKKVTCTKKEEDLLIGQNGLVSIDRQYTYKLQTLTNDIGFGSKTGDLIEQTFVVSKNGNKFETGKKYWVEFKPV